MLGLSYSTPPCVMGHRAAALRGAFAGLLLLVVGLAPGHGLKVNTTVYDYCVVGAGPGGLQAAYFLHRANRSYVVLEKEGIAGSFFVKYPRMRKLISINKRYTGHDNIEFQKRHDWNSLLSDNYANLRVSNFTDEYYPNADHLVEYLQAFASTNNLNIHYNTSVNLIYRPKSSDADVSELTGRTPFLLNSTRTVNGVATERWYQCAVVISAVGFSVPRRPTSKNADFMETYADVPVDPRNFTRQNVLIIGKGNSAFELADMMTKEANFIHLLSRTPVRLSFFTHYVGDVRAVNNKFLDHYQLKSLDALMEMDANEAFHIERAGEGFDVFIHDDGKIVSAQAENHPLRKRYHRIISCMGWRMNSSMYRHSSVRPHMGEKYPITNDDYESVNVPDLYFAGALMHSKDVRKSSGGFIHGFRYIVQALARILDRKYHKEQWPRQTVNATVDDFGRAIIERINSVSSMYQMFGVIGDVFVLPSATTCDPASGSCSPSGVIQHVRDVPLQRLHKYDFAQQKGQRLVTLKMVYGKHFFGERVLARDRAASDPLMAHHSRFLHPVLELLEVSDSKGAPEPSRDGQPEDTPPAWTTEPTDSHHILEDFLTEWGDQSEHVVPLHTFLQRVLSGNASALLKSGVQFEDADLNLYGMDDVRRGPAEKRSLLLDALWQLERITHALTEAGEHVGAAQLWKTVLNARRRLYGDGHIDVEVTKALMSTRMSKAGYAEHGHRMASSALQTLQQRLPSDHPAVEFAQQKFEETQVHVENAKAGTKW